MENLKYIKITTCAVLFSVFSVGVQAQYSNLKLHHDAKKHGEIVVDRDTVYGDYNQALKQLTVMSQNGYTATPSFTDSQSAFFSVKKSKEDLLQVSFNYNFQNKEQQGTLVLMALDGTVKEVIVKQKANSSAGQVQSDTKLKIASGQASQAQGEKGLRSHLTVI